MFPKNLLVDPRFAVEPVKVPDARQTHQVVIAREILRQKKQVIRFFSQPGVFLAVVAAGGEIRLESDDRA